MKIEYANVQYENGRAYIESFYLNGKGKRKLKRNYGEIRACKECKDDFFSFDVNINCGRGFYCTKECANRLKNHPRWNGGVADNGHGYKMVMAPDHPFRNNRNYVLEHRLVVEGIIGRFLKPEEAVHHRGDKRDNRPIMLMLFVNNSAHTRFHNNPDNVESSEIIFDGRKLELNNVI